MPAIVQTTSWAPEEQPLILRSGPHLDLSALCDYFNKEHVDKSHADDRPYNEHLYKISNLVKRMLHESRHHDRLAAARSLLEIEPQCGLAFTILAREGATTMEDVGNFYRNAVGFLRQETLIRNGDFEAPHDSYEPIGAFIHCEKLVALVSAEFARWLRVEGANDEANAVLSKTAELTDDPNDAFAELFAWYMKSDRVADARAMLDRCLSNHPRWYYMFAFMLYKESGDTIVSRSAMRHACHVDDLIAHALVGDNLHRISRYRIATNEERRSEASAFASTLKDAMLATPGLRQFLIDAACRSVPSFPIVTELSGNSLPLDAGRSSRCDAIAFKKWKDNLEMVDSSRGKDKLWKKYLRSGLKEAEKFPVECWEYYATLRYAAMNRELSGYTKRDIMDMCNRRLSKVSGSCNQRAAALVFFEVACLFEELMEYEKSEELFAKSISALDAHSILEPDDADLFLKRLILYKWAHAYVHNSQRAQAAPLFDQVRALGRMYLGSNHRDP